MPRGLDVTVTVLDPHRRGKAHVAVTLHGDVPSDAITAAIAERAATALGVSEPATTDDAPAPTRGRPPAGPVLLEGSAVPPWLHDGAVLTLTRSPDGALTLTETDPAVVSDPGAAPRPLASTASAAAATVTTTPYAVEVRVVGGPDAGAGVVVTADRPATIGRAETADLRLTSARVSRRHARLAVGPSGAVTVADLGSANGVTVHGVRVTTAAVDESAVVGVGDDVLCVAPRAVPAAATRARPDGTVAVHRPPRVESTVAQPVITVPAPPAAPRRQRVPLAAVGLPLVAGAVMCAVLGSWQYLAFAALSPLVVAGSVVGDRRSSRAEHRAALAAYATAAAEAAAELAAACAADEQSRRAAAPDPATTLLVATLPGDRLWERRPDDADFLRLRVGLADASARVDLRAEPGAPLPAAPTARAVPRTLDLRRLGVVGIAGPPERATALAAWLVAQAAVLHSPDDLAVVLLGRAADEADWGFVRWLPHAKPREGDDCHATIAVDDATVERRLAALTAALGDRDDEARAAHATLVVVDRAAQLRDHPALAHLLRHGPAAGTYAICVEEDERLLPAECGATVCFPDGAPGEVTARVDGEPVATGVLADQVAPPWREAVARGLAPLRPAEQPLGYAADARTAVEPLGRAGHVTRSTVAWSSPARSSQVRPKLARSSPTRSTLSDALASPPAPRLTDCADTPAADPTAIRRGWQRATGPVATLGVGPDGPVRLDLRREGPHVLVAGTTGSGKSELLQTLVTSLALGQPPDELAFVLVDYKGGAAFRECARLPHVTGLVTDLDGRLTSRALTSLSAELRRREAVLAAAGVADIDALPTRPRAVGLPRLVIVVDEFATLVEELPDFVRGLVGIAARGRSLGLHLVLATQRPGGAVGADIRANTNARICLRVTSAADAQDVLDAPEAARIPESRPGLGYLKCGSGPLVPFQTARVTMRRRSEQGELPGVRCVLVPWETVGHPRPRDPRADTDDVTAGDPAAADLRGLVDAAGAAASDRPRPPAPWLPPLPSRIPLGDLERAFSVPARDRDADDIGPLLLGVLDRPERQQQAPLEHDLARDGHLLVIGTTGSGRTTTLRTVAATLAATCSPANAHLYVIDCGGGLAPLAGWPQCGAYVGRDDPERMARLVARLLAEVDARATALARGGFTDVAEQRRKVGPGARLPWIVLLVDGWEAVLDLGRDGPVGPIAGGVLRLLREGTATGVRVVVTAGRAGLTGQLAGLVGRRLVLRQSDAGDYALAGVDARSAPSPMPAGRALVVGSGKPAEAQIAVIGGDVTAEAQNAALSAAYDAVAPAAPRPTAESGVAVGPFRVDALPRHVSVSAVRAATTECAREAPLRVDIGIGGDESHVLGVDLARDGPALLVVGRAGTGRTTAVRAAMASARARGTPVVVVARPGRPAGEAVAVDAEPDSSAADETAAPVVAAGAGTVVDDADSLDAALAAAGGPVLVVADDALALDDRDLDAALCRLLRAARGRRVGLVVAATTDDLLTAFRGVGLELRRSRSVLLLGPARPGDAELIGGRLAAPDAAAPPGRGWLRAAGVLEPIQVAAPDRSAPSPLG